MNDYQKEIRSHARNLLEEKKVDLVIGYQDSSAPMMTEPCFARDISDVDLLVWNLFCENNLANYLIGKTEKIAIIAKACDVRSITVLINEKQVERENIVIIAVNDDRVIDRRKVEAAMDWREIQKAETDGDKLIVKTCDAEKTLTINDYLHESCQAEDVDITELCDIVIGKKPSDKKEVDKFEQIKELENKTPQQRWDFFKKELSKCIRCYACRNACPLCYCKQCFVDQAFGAWLGRSTDISDTMCFHIMRAMHTTGRCVDCGACVRACPNNIDLRLLTQKIEKDVKQLFGDEAGLDPSKNAPMVSYEEDDPQEFIK